MREDIKIATRQSYGEELAKLGEENENIVVLDADLTTATKTELFAEKYPTGCPVRGYAQGAEEKTIYMLSAEQVMNWCADLSMHIGTCKQAGWAKQAEVQAATTKEELDSIVLD